MEYDRTVSGADGPISSLGRSTPPGAFLTTHWSQVLSARDRDSPESAEALEQLCRAYWRPLYAYIRRRGYGPREAEDLTQGFFERMLAKHYLGDLTPGTGRFRSFLLTSVNHYLANEWDRARTLKRGGNHMVVSLEEIAAGGNHSFEPADEVTPEHEFDRLWASTLLDAVLARLRAEFVAGERAELFDPLKPFLTVDQPPGLYAQIAATTGLKEGTVKVAVHRLRRRYGELLREEVARTVGSPEDVQDELRHLIRALAS